MGTALDRTFKMDIENTLGLTAAGESASRRQRRLRQVNLQLVASGLPVVADADAEFTAVARDVVDSFRMQARLLGEHRCPADQRIEAFLQDHFNERLRLPDRTVILGQHGLARELSLPAHGDEFTNPLLSSYRVRNGVLHNPKSDRRTTQGTFHVTEGGLPVPFDKKAVPKAVFAELFRHAVNPPAELLEIPFTSGGSEVAKSFVSLLLRPLVCPEVRGVCPAKSMEIRFFAPGSLVSNLDFVESIFSNAGDPFLPQNDAALDVEHWTGHTGCVILAPQLVELTKKQLGLPRWEEASERQRRDGMCWNDGGELYNDGTAFKITCRTEAGVIVTLLADNYYGYCKKEVKTQISYAANLYGNVEEEHSGGAIAFTSYNFGDDYQTDSRKVNGRTFADIVRDYGTMMDVQPEGYAIDRKFPDVVYIPDQTRASAKRQQMWWTHEGVERAIPMLPGKVYMTPSGFKLQFEKHPGAPSWRIIGTVGQGCFCHKPSTVSGGGKSEISKSLKDYMLYGPLFVADVDKDLDTVAEIFSKDYSNRWNAQSKLKQHYNQFPSRPILSPERSLGSVIKLLTPSSEYTDEHNRWLESLPSYIYPIVFIIKRFYRTEWNGDWRSHFGVDIVNGFPAHELKYKDRKLVGTYLRVGLMPSQAGSPTAWRTYKIRQDFAAATKIQMEDDISASVVVPTNRLLYLNPAYIHGSTRRDSVKFAANCEYRLFQRPDEAVHRGFDKQTEADMARNDNFISNFEPLTGADVKAMVERVAEFDQFTAPMRRMLRSVGETGYVVSSANPRLVGGKPSKNPRYLQIRPDLLDPMSSYVADQGLRFLRMIPLKDPVYWPVDAVLIGRRNNPADPAAGIRPLAVYNPIHYQDLPELFMDFICSLTGKSPSTTGAGSEGALTKSPFNALRPTADLNSALASFILTGLGGFSTAAGYIGPKVRVDHDISLLVPEIWCRLSPEERDPQNLIRQGYLEQLEDFEYEGETILQSRLGYRITSDFVRAYFGRVFDNPLKVFDESILKPETQDLAQYVDGIKNITEAQQRVAIQYLEDGSIAEACPPLQALLEIMATGKWQGKDAHHHDVRKMFTRDFLLNSEWYNRRLAIKQDRDVALWERHLASLDAFISNPRNLEEAERLGLAARRDMVVRELEKTRSSAYLESLVGTLGADPLGTDKTSASKPSPAIFHRDIAAKVK
jgi:hypothetical protein